MRSISVHTIWLKLCASNHKGSLPSYVMASPSVSSSTEPNSYYLQGEWGFPSSSLESERLRGVEAAASSGLRQHFRPDNSLLVNFESAFHL